VWGVATLVTAGAYDHGRSEVNNKPAPVLFLRSESVLQPLAVELRFVYFSVKANLHPLSMCEELMA
jgi:hypothetical protein